MSTQRNKELARIHIMKTELGMSDDAYRAMLMTIGRVKSAARLDVRGRYQVIAHMKEKLPGKPRGKQSPQDKKIRALWFALASKGIVKSGTEASLRVYVNRQTGCERLEWLTSKEASQVIESLKQWQARTA